MCTCLAPLTQYNDKKLTAFGVDAHIFLVITFPVFIKALNKESLPLYDIVTVPFPINELHGTASNYSTAIILKPYMAIDDEYYIQLCI